MTKLQARQKKERKAEVDRMVSDIAYLKAQNPAYTDAEILSILRLLHIATMPMPLTIRTQAATEIIFCDENEFYNACVAGAECGYNRTTYDYAYLKEVINKMRKDDGQVPVSLIMEHHHKQMQPCEPHARVMLGHPRYIFDIPMDHWNHLNGKERRELETVATVATVAARQSKRL